MAMAKAELTNFGGVEYNKLDRNEIYNDIIGRANDYLLYKKFDDCLDLCHTYVKEWRNYTENDNVAEAMEALVALAIQAYAELNRWQEVLPFVTQVYNGLEDCPAFVAQLCLSLYAKLKDYVTCTVVAGIWLKNPANSRRQGYQALTEMYVARVLLPNSRWDDVEPFLTSCPGLDSSACNSLLQKVKVLNQRQQMLLADEIQVLESNIETSNGSASSKKQSNVNNLQLFDYKNALKSIARYFPTSFLYMARNFIVISAVMYVLITRWRAGKFSPFLLRLWMLLVRFWKGMFAPFYDINR